MSPRFFASSSDRSVAVSGSELSQAYGLLAMALLVTLVGVFAGGTFALPIIASGWMIALFILEFAIIVTAPAWSRSTPLNYILFFAFPFISGLTITPFLMYVLAGYANGAAILLNATIATVLMAGAAAVFARTTTMNIGASLGGFMLTSLIGLVVLGILQLFVPALRGSGIEVVASGIGIVTFSLFLAWDIQRVMHSGRGTSPFLLALSLYLDIFNLFMYIVRFMLAMSGNRR